MKKMYCKPEIMFESFALSTNIAASCDVVVSNHSENVCGLEWGDEMIFITGITACDNGTPVSSAEGQYNGICYHVPTETSDMFNS